MGFGPNDELTDGEVGEFVRIGTAVIRELVAGRFQLGEAVAGRSIAKELEAVTAVRATCFLGLTQGLGDAVVVDLFDLNMGGVGLGRLAWKKDVLVYMAKKAILFETDEDHGSSS
jgi:hypothetical protein